MRSRHLMVGAALLLVLPFARADEPPDTGKAPIARLVTQLGSDSFLEREQARKELQAIGAPALDVLRRAARTADLETSRRAAELVRVIEEHMLTRALLAPKRVRLTVKDEPVLQAVAKLAKLSGYAVRVDGDRTLLAGKTVTLETGDVSFWNAVDRLAAASGLVEKQTVAALPAEPVPTNDIYYFSDVTALRVNPQVMMLMNRGRGKLVLPPPPLRIMPLPQERKAQENTAPAEPAAKVAAPPLLPGCVILTPGTIRKQYASDAGAVRVLLKYPRAGTVADRAYDLVLGASAEPRLLGFTLVGVPTVTRAVDEHGQVLSCVIDPTPASAPTTPLSPAEALKEFFGQAPTPAQPLQRGVTIRLQAGSKPATRLRELSGSLSAQVFLPNTTLLDLDNVLKAKGKSADLKGGGRLVLDNIETIANGTSKAVEYRVVCKLDPLAGTTGVMRNGRLVNVSSGPLGNDCVLELRDAKGRRLTLANAPRFNQENDAQGQVIRISLTMQFYRDAGQGEPVRMLLIGTDTPTIHVPFHFENVPLR